MRKNNTYVCIRPSLFRFRRAIVLGVCGVGIPASIQNLLNVTGMTVLNNFTSSYGSDVVAAMGIAQKINMVPMYVAMGISQGIMPLISYNYASGNTDRMKKTVLFAGKASVGFLLVMAGIYYIFAGGLISLFMKNGSVVSYGTPFLRGMCFALPFMCLDFLAVGVFQACGMGTKALIFAILRKIVLEIPALYLLNGLFPIYGLAYAQPLAEFVLAVAAIWNLVRIFRELGKKKQVGE